MKNLQLTQEEIHRLFTLAGIKAEECKEGSLQQELYEKLSKKLWEVYSNNK